MALQLHFGRWYVGLEKPEDIEATIKIGSLYVGRKQDKRIEGTKNDDRMPIQDYTAEVSRLIEELGKISRKSDGLESRLADLTNENQYYRDVVAGVACDLVFYFSKLDEEHYRLIESRGEATDWDAAIDTHINSLRLAKPYLSGYGGDYFEKLRTGFSEKTEHIKAYEEQRGVRLIYIPRLCDIINSPDAPEEKKKKIVGLLQSVLKRKV